MNRTLARFAVCLLSVPVLATGAPYASPEDASKELLSAEHKTEKTREVKAKDLSLRIPVSWKQQRPTNRMRLARFLRRLAHHRGLRARPAGSRGGDTRLA